MNNKAAVRESVEAIRRDTSNFPVQMNARGLSVGQNIVVELPGERLQVEVAEVINPEHVIVELTSQPFSKTHTYTKGDFIPARLVYNGLENIWQAYRPAPKGKRKS